MQESPRPDPEELQGQFEHISLRDVYALCDKIHSGKGDVSPEEYEATFSNARESLLTDFSAGIIPSDQLAKEMTDLSRLQSEIGLSIFSSLKKSKIDKKYGVLTYEGFLERANNLREEKLRFVEKGASAVLLVLFADLNNLKRINDDFKDHEPGDAAIQAVIDTLKLNLRSGDVIGRRGGDEIVAIVDGVFFPGIPEKEATQKAEATVERLRRKLEDIRFSVDYRGETISLQTSAALGYSITTDVQNADINELINSADHDMYQAKQSAREGKGQNSN